MLLKVAVAQIESRPAEVRRLQLYVGRWREAGQMGDDPSKPFKPVAGGATCSRSAGGYVLCEEKTEGAGGGWDGVYILSYDAAGRSAPHPRSRMRT
jgi:hypothetical protein